MSFSGEPVWGEIPQRAISFPAALAMLAIVLDEELRVLQNRFT
jgi:hypothetical protein